MCLHEVHAVVNDAVYCEKYGETLLWNASQLLTTNAINSINSF